jgi:CRP-like cAMP-binding protein
MPQLSKSVSNKPPANSAKGLIGGQVVKNRILLALPAKERAVIFAMLQFVPLPLSTKLTEKGSRIKFAYFLNDGLASVLNVMKNEKSIEVGLCGKEGFIGLPLIVGFTTSPAQVVMQIGGSGFRITAVDLAVCLRRCPALMIALSRFAQEMGVQSAQVAACNRLHDVDERLARWLLMSQDRIGGSVVLLTQNYLSHMLGTRRASVTVAAGILQKAGLITYKRGAVTIENRNLLEEATCECYGVLTRQVEKWQSEVNQMDVPRIRSMALSRIPELSANDPMIMGRSRRERKPHSIEVDKATPVGGVDILVPVGNGS